MGGQSMSVCPGCGTSQGLPCTPTCPDRARRVAEQDARVAASSLSSVDTAVLREFARVLRDQVILDHARSATWPSAPEVALESVEAELAKRFDNRWVP